MGYYSYLDVSEDGYNDREEDFKDVEESQSGDSVENYTNAQDLLEKYGNGEISRFECETGLVHLYEKNIIAYGELNILIHGLSRERKSYTVGCGILIG